MIETSGRVVDRAVADLLIAVEHAIMAMPTAMGLPHIECQHGPRRQPLSDRLRTWQCAFAVDGHSCAACAHIAGVCKSDCGCICGRQHMFCQTAQPLQMLTRFGYNRLLHLFAARTAQSTRTACAPKVPQAQHRLQSGITGCEPPLRRFAASAAAPLLGSTRLTSSRQHPHRCSAEAATSMEMSARPCAEAAQITSCALLSTSMHDILQDCQLFNSSHLSSV